MVDSVSTRLDLEADFRHGGTAGQRHLAATLCETRFRPRADRGQKEKQSLNIGINRHTVLPPVVCRVEPALLRIADLVRNQQHSAD